MELPIVPAVPEETRFGREGVSKAESPARTPALLSVRVVFIHFTPEPEVLSRLLVEVALQRGSIPQGLTVTPVLKRPRNALFGQTWTPPASNN